MGKNTKVATCPYADTYDNLLMDNPILKNGQRVYDTTNEVWYTGDGITEFEFLVPDKTDLSNYYTKTEIDEKIDNSEIGDVDLSNYYTKEEVESVVEDIDFVVTAEIQPTDETLSNFTVVNPSHTYTEIKSAVDDGKNCVGIFTIPGLGTSVTQNILVSELGISFVTTPSPVFENGTTTNATVVFSPDETQKVISYNYYDAYAVDKRFYTKEYTESLIENKIDKDEPFGLAYGIDYGTQFQLNIGDSNSSSTYMFYTKSQIDENTVGQHYKENDEIKGEIFNDYDNNKASGECSHAEGDRTKALGLASHAEGVYTIASGECSHAEGDMTQALGNHSHAEGHNTQAIGSHSHTEGRDTIASGENSHSEGESNFAGQKAYYYSDFDVDNNTFTISDVKGPATTTIDTGWEVGDLVSIVNDAKYYRFATIENINGNVITVSNMPTWEQPNGIVEVDFTKFDGFDDFTIFVQDKPENGIIDIGQCAHVEGRQNKALANAAHAEGRKNIAFGQYSHVEGRENFAYHAAHAEGWNTRALAMMAHSEGDGSLALGKATHAEGQRTKAEGLASHAEGLGTIASGHQAHSEGYRTNAGNYSHAEGYDTVAESGVNHAEGRGTHATEYAQHVQGTFNYLDENGKAGNYAHIVGNGHADFDESGNVITEHRSNAHTLDWNGNAWFAGEVTIGEKKEKLVADFIVTATLLPKDETMFDFEVVDLSATLHDILEAFYSGKNIVGRFMLPGHGEITSLNIFSSAKDITFNIPPILPLLGNGTLSGIQVTVYMNDDDIHDGLSAHRYEVVSGAWLDSNEAWVVNVDTQNGIDSPVVVDAFVDMFDAFNSNRRVYARIEKYMLRAQYCDSSQIKFTGVVPGESENDDMVYACLKVTSDNTATFWMK